MREAAWPERAQRAGAAVLLAALALVTVGGRPAAGADRVVLCEEFTSNG